MDHLAAYADSDEDAPAAPALPAALAAPAPATHAQDDAHGAPASTAAPAATEHTVAAPHEAAAWSGPQAQAPTSLPNDGWVEYKTAQGASYFYHIPTQVTTWDRPAPFQTAPKSPAAASSPAPSPAAKPAATAPRKPVSWEPIPGSEWRRVLMSDGERVFYNPRTKASAWTLPPDALPQPASAPAPVPVTAPPTLAPAVPVPVAVSVPAAATSAPVAKAAAASEAAVGQKRALEEEAPAPAAEKAPRSEADEAAAAVAAAEAEATRAAEERAREEEAGRREAFRALLREKRVGPLSHWDKELPRLAFDPRFALLPRMADRRAEFDAFRMSRGEEERSAKVAAVQRVKEARAALAALLDAHVTSAHSAPRLSELRAQHAADAAFGGGLEAREVERMYNERIEALRRGEEAARQALHKRFVDLLLERLRPDEAESWRSARRALSAADAAWDAPFGAISERRREELFEEYERQMRHRRHALRQREQEARREREAVERDMERRRADLTRDEALAALRAAMRERCRVVDMPWAEAARLLAGDARWESGALREAEKAEAYGAHQEALRAHLAGEYRAWLVEQNATGALPLGAAFAPTDARADKRFRPLPEAERAAVFERFAAALVAEARDDLVRLLRETRQLHRQVEARGDLDGVRRLLEKDARYVRLAALPAEREATIAEYIRTQAPPPPQGGQLRAAIEAAEEELNPTMPRFSVAMVGQSEKELGL